MIGSDVYICWRAALRGEAIPDAAMLPTGPGGINGNPQAGVYRRREGGGYDAEGKKRPVTYTAVKIYLVHPDAPDTPVHKWAEGLELRAIIGREPKDVDPVKVWQWCIRNVGGQAIPNAVSGQDYKHYIETGAWPEAAPSITATPEPAVDFSPAAVAPQPEPASDIGPSPDVVVPAPAGMGHNSENDPDGAPALLALLRQHDAAIAEWIKQGQQGTVAANKATNWTRDMIALEKRVIAAYDALKAPILEATRKLDETWRPVKDAADKVKRKIDGHRQAVAAKEQQRQQAIKDAEAKAAAAAIRARLEAEREAQLAAQRAAAPATGELPLEAPAALPPITEPIVVPETVKLAFGGGTGNKMGVRAAPVAAVITDWQAAAVHYAMSPKVQEVVQKLANAEAKSGVVHSFMKTGEKAA